MGFLETTRLPELALDVREIIRQSPGLIRRRLER